MFRADAKAQEKLRAPLIIQPAQNIEMPIMTSKRLPEFPAMKAPKPDASNIKPITNRKFAKENMMLSSNDTPIPALFMKLSFLITNVANGHGLKLDAFGGLSARIPF